MQAKPLIGLNADYRDAKSGQPAFTYLTAGYYDSVMAAGGIPVVLPPLDNEDDIAAALEPLSGFVLCGGADLDPYRDGYMRHSSVKLMSSRREVFDRKLMDVIADRRLPVFGIGVGMQLINVHQGGTLFYHIPEDLPHALPHRDHLDPSHRHGLIVEGGSIMERIFGDGEIRVNSMHHMAIDDLAPGLRVTARCPDGVIEAIENDRPDWFVMGTQFHPESQSATAIDIRIFEEFVEGIGETVPAAIRMVA